MSFEDYGRKKYSGQSSNEQSFTDYARGRYGTERGDAYAASQKSKEQISNALNSFVDGYKRRRAEENAALEAAKAAEKERKRQEELVKYGVKKAGSVTGSLSAIASAAEALERRLNPQRSTPENAARVLENKRRETSQIMPNGSFGKTAMPYSDRERVPAKAVETVQPEETHTGARKQRRQKGSIQSMDRRLNALSPVVSPMIETGAQEETQNSPRTVDLDKLLARGAYANNNRLQRDADKWISTASNGAKRAAKQEGDELLYIDGAAQAEYLRAKKAYDDYVAKYDRMQGPFLDGKGNLITNDDINARKAELKAAMDAAMDAARAEQRHALAGEYKWLANRPDFKENLQNGYRREDQVFETVTDGARFKSEEAQLIYNMTGAERRILTYLRNTQGEDAAKDYIAVLKPDLEKRVHSDIERRSVELAEKHPGVAIVVRTAANLDNTIRGGAYTLKSAAAKLLGIEGAEIDPYSLSYTGGTARNAIQNNIGERLNKYFADNEDVQKYLSNMGRNLGVKELSSGKAPQFVFDTIMSGVVDSTVAGVIGAATGYTAVSAALVSGSAVVDTAREIKLQGGSDERALALGSVAGLLEYATEKIGFDRLADMITKGGKGGIRALFSNMASEYMEEGGSSIGNYLAEWAADAIEGVNMSTFRQTRQAYINEGLSEADATRRTWVDFAVQVNRDGMGGALGGAIMGGGAQVVGKVFNAVAQHEFDRAVAKAGEDGDIAAKAYKFNDDGMLRRGDYDKAFDTIWDGAANGLTLEQIEQAAPDIMALLDDKQKQGIFDAAKNDAKQKAAAELKKKTDKEYKALFGEEDAKAEADKGKQKAMQANLDDGKSADEAAKTPAVQRPQIQITQIDEAGKRTESTVFERKNTETAKQAQTELTETQPAREHALEQHETTAEPPMSRDQTKGVEILDRTKETRQRGAEAVSERVSEENRGEIEAYVTDQKKTAKGGVRRSYAAKNLTRDQKGQIRILDEMGRHYGVEIEVVDSIEGGKVQGMYDGGNRIKVALDAGNQAYVQVGTHELVHYLKNKDDAGYRVVEKMVVDELSKAEGFSLEDAIAERRAEYAAQDVMIDDSAAIEEIVAEALPSIWGDKRAVNAFVSQNRSLAQKVRDFIVDFVERLKQYAVDYAVDQDRTEILALQSREQDAVGTLEQIARTFDLALESAREKGENGTEQTETQPAREHTTEQHETAAEQPVSRDNVEGGVRRGHTMEQDSESENNIRVLDMIGKHYGFEFETFDATEDSNVRSTYDGGRRIKVPIYAVYSDSDFDAYVHEGTRWLTEYLKNKNETGYRVVEKMVLDVLGKDEKFSLEDAIARRRAKYAAQGVLIDDNAAIEEIVADVLPTIWGERSILMKIFLRAREMYTDNGDIDDYTRDEYSLFYDLAHDVWMRNESYSRWQKAPEILVMAESGLRSNTLDRIAYAFDAAMKEALEKDENGTGETETADEQAKPARERTNQAQHIELPDGVKYSIRRFDEQIQDVIDGKFPENDHVYVMETPEVLQSIGLKKLPMLMTQKHAYTTTMAEGKYSSTDVNYHALGLETMQKLPNAIADPLMVIKSHNYDGRITVITELTDSESRPVIVPVIVDGYGKWNNVDVAANVVASAYGRQKIWNDAKEALKSGEVLYVDKKRSDLLAQSLKVQYDDALNEDRSSADIIADLTRAVKGENEENQQKISESSEENADQAQNEGETEAVESADGNDGAQADNASDGVRFSLKSESANKVDMDQTLRAGDNSVAEQTETQEQTRHTPVDVTDNMRQWADKRAGQIIREYRSTIDADSVKADVARLVSELAEHGASSDALNAAVNMAKGIIEKSSRLDNTLRDQYSDLRRQMRKTPIMLSDLQKQEAANITGSYGRYRQSLFGSVNLVNESNTSLDQAWEEWSEQHPELFTPGLNEGDQVARLAEIKTMFEPKYVNEYGEHLDAAAADLGMSLYSEALRMVGDAARAQQVTKDINDMRSRYSKATREALQKVRNEQVARFKAIAGELQAARQAGDRARQDAIMNDYRANMRRAGMQQVEAEARSAYRAQFEDAAAWRKAHERTIKYARTLRQELAKPTKQKHIPAGLEKPVLDVLNRIDMSATGRDTQGARQWRDSLESIAKWLDEQDRLQTNALDESQSASEGHEGVWMAICGRNIQDLRAAINVVSGTNGRVASMSLQEINALSNAMSVINHSVNSINETWTLSRNETLNQLGDRSVSEMQKKRTNRAQDSKIPMLRELDTLLNVDQLDAVSFFERLGDVGGDVAESLTAGQSKAYERVREAADASREIFAIDGVKDERKRREMIRGWRREQHTFTLTRGTTTQDVTMSGTQLMELYALSKRNQALKHILSGGIRIAGQEGKTGDVYNYQVTQEQLDHMLGELTPEQKQVVDRMQAYLSGDVAGWGNEVTMEMYLYKAFNEKNYWPIKSDTDYKRTKEQDGSVMYNALLNASWTKAVVDKPSNPITIGDAIETFAGHVSDMATYSGLAMPVDDLLKWYNYQSRDENGKADYNGSVKKEIRRTIGAVGTQYIQRLMDDLNGMGRRSYESDLIGKAISNYKRAAIMAKLRVVIQQPTAILRASALIDPKYFSGMTRGIGKNAIAEMQEHSGLAWWKSNGNYEIGTGASMKSIITGMQDTAREAIGEKLGAPAGMADDLGWVCIWQAVKRETEARHPNMEVGSDAYWNIVRNRFEDVCIRTQVVDTVLTRSQLMRSKSQLMKSVTAFMSEPTKNYNLIRNALSAVYNAKTPDERKAAIGTLARSAAAIAAAQALNAVVTAAHDMLKYYDPDDEDEDGEEITRIDMFADNWFSDMMDGINPLANIPIIKDVYALMMGEDVERMDLAVISDVIDAIKKLDNYVSGGNTRGLNAWGAVRPLLKAIGDVTGLPASGLIADTELLLNIVSPGITRSIQRESNTSDAYTMIYRALAAGDAKKAASLRAKLKGGAFGKTPKSDKEIDAGVRDVLAISDDRIRRCFEMKQQGGNTKELAALQKEIAADGFTMEQVVGAVNNYARLVGRTVRDNYKAAYLVKDEKQMKLYADQAKSLGYDDDDIAGWVAEKDLNEQLSGEMYTKDDMMSYIRKGTDGDIKDVVDYRISVSSADNPEQSVRNAIASEFRDEYIELFNSGDAGGAQKLKNRLLAAGLSEKAIDGWVYTNDGLKAYLLDGQGTKEQAQDILEYKVRFSDAKNPEDSSVNALKSYRDEYIELARSDRKKAEAMAKRLIDLGLSESLIDTWNDAAKEEEK